MVTIQLERDGFNCYANQAECNQFVLPVSVDKQIKRYGLYGLGQAYIDGLFESANLDILIEQFIAQPELLPGKYSPVALLEIVYERFFNPQRGTGSYEVAQHHYDLGNQLFKAMLDKSMTYTCGYWGIDGEISTLELAQQAKLEMICKKLKLKPGMRVLDIGCGWGNFAEHAARKYGVEVVGVTVSKEQASFASKRCKDLKVEILLKDYREISGQFDRVVSIEMIEAVGRKNISTFFKTVSRCLKPSGLFVLQAISTEIFTLRSLPATDQYMAWLTKYIFPNGYIPKQKELSDQNITGLVLEDMHNLSTNYEKTLSAWRDNFVLAWPQLCSKFDERFRRIWLYYLSGCMAFFRTRQVQVYQIVYSNSGKVI
jgi:cyclopropane-fatty-acyl-phospholipid synthase